MFMILNLMVELKMLEENELVNEEQEKADTICLGGSKHPLLLSHRFWDSDLSVFNWSDSFHISFCPIYEDFSMQMDLSFPEHKIFKTKGTIRS